MTQISKIRGATLRLQLTLRDAITRVVKDMSTYSCRLSIKPYSEDETTLEAAAYTYGPTAGTTDANGHVTGPSVVLAYASGEYLIELRWWIPGPTVTPDKFQAKLTIEPRVDKDA